jgi:hypothetical protein
MTTYQDPPLQSRRAVRQGERVEQSAPPFTPPQLPRTAAGAGEPLSYVTQNRPPLPGYDTAPPRGRRSSVPEPEAAPEQPSSPSFRPRDFSPEARTAPPAWAPEYDRENGVLDHHTQVRAPAAPQQGGSLAASLASEPTEQTLTRRELRAIRDSHGITAAATDATPVVADAAAGFAQAAPVAYQAPVPPYQPSAFQAPAEPQQFAPPAPAPSTQLDSAMAEFDALAGRSAGAEPSRRAGRRSAPQTDVAPEDGLGAFDAMFAPPAAVADPVTPTTQGFAPQIFEPQTFEPQPFEPQAAPQAPQRQAPVPQIASQAPVAPHPAPVQQPQPAPAAEQHPVAVPSAPAPTTGERPIGHWTTQSDIDDRTQVSESTISRRVGSGAITTSALVLPSIPGHNMSTGEVMLTDSISLPSSLAETGAHSPIDESDIDHLLDPGDHQLVNTDSVPIRAIKAVSSHTGSRGQLIANTKPAKGHRALTALIVSASGMVVVVVTLLVVALATEVI